MYVHMYVPLVQPPLCAQLIAPPPHILFIDLGFRRGHTGNLHCCVIRLFGETKGWFAMWCMCIALLKEEPESSRSFCCDRRQRRRGEQFKRYSVRRVANGVPPRAHLYISYIICITGVGKSAAESKLFNLAAHTYRETWVVEMIFAPEYRRACSSAGKRDGRCRLKILRAVCFESAHLSIPHETRQVSLYL